MSNTNKAVADAAEQPAYAPASTRSAFFWRDNTMPNAPDWPATKGTPGPKAHGGPLLGSLSNKLYDVNGRRTVSLAPKGSGLTRLWV